MWLNILVACFMIFVPAYGFVTGWICSRRRWLIERAGLDEKIRILEKALSERAQ